MTTVRMEEKAHVVDKAREHGVRFIELWFTDILGFLKALEIPIQNLEDALEQGIEFDGSAIEAFARDDERNAVALPDVNTFQILPVRPPESHVVARMFCDILTLDGHPFEGDPRYVLKRNLRRASELGYTFYLRPKLEYFYFQNQEGVQVSNKQGCFDLAPLDVDSRLTGKTLLALQEMGIGVEYRAHELLPSQHGVDLKYGDALTMADNVMTYRLLVKQIASRHGVSATFMPKPLSNEKGGGMQIRQSLLEGDSNVFLDKYDRYQLSRIAKSYIASLLKHAPEFTAITNQWVNSYKRLVPGYETPIYVAWGRMNRSALIRIPAPHEPDKEIEISMEFRCLDSACNPYFAFSVMLAAGLEGIEKEYKLASPIEENLFEMTEKERKERGTRTLPQSLSEAIKLTENSELVRKCLGEHAFASFIKNKKSEWDGYQTQVTDYELKTYLPTL